MAVATLLTVRVQPRAQRDEVAGYGEGVLRVRLRALPVEGRANESLRRFLAERLGLTQSDIEIVSGKTGRTKQVRVTGLNLYEIRARLDR